MGVQTSKGRLCLDVLKAAGRRFTAYYEQHNLSVKTMRSSGPCPGWACSVRSGSRVAWPTQPRCLVHLCHAVLQWLLLLCLGAPLGAACTWSGLDCSSLQVDFDALVLLCCPVLIVVLAAYNFHRRTYGDRELVQFLGLQCWPGSVHRLSSQRDPAVHRGWCSQHQRFP